MIINYDVFSPQSETASLEIPELDFEVGGGILGGKFTTLEGKFNHYQSTTYISVLPFVLLRCMFVYVVDGAEYIAYKFSLIA